MSKFKVGDEVAIATVVKITAIQPTKTGNVSYATDRGFCIHEVLMDEIALSAKPSDRLTGREEPKPEPKPAHKFKVGDRVEINLPGLKDKSGEISAVDEDDPLLPYLVFHEHGFHSGTKRVGVTKPEHACKCSWFAESMLGSASEPPKFYTGKVFAEKTENRCCEPAIARNGHVFSIVDGYVTGDVKKYALHRRNPFRTFDEFKDFFFWTTWHEVKSDV